jgi:hypothetical protein
VLQLITNDTAVTNSAATTGVFAALLMALNFDMFLLSYTLFIISSVLWVVFAYRNSNRQLLIMNIIFLVVDVIGFIRFY